MGSSNCVPSFACYTPVMSLSETELAKTFAQRADRERVKAERSADQHKASRQKLRAAMYRRFALRLKAAGSGIWTKE